MTNCLAQGEYKKSLIKKNMDVMNEYEGLKDHFLFLKNSEQYLSVRPRLSLIIKVFPFFIHHVGSEWNIYLTVFS